MGRQSHAGASRLGGSGGGGRACGGGNQRAIGSEGAVSQAAGVVGSTSGAVRVGVAAALVIDHGALLSTLVASRSSGCRASRGRSRGRSGSGAGSRGDKRSVGAEGAVAQASSILGGAACAVGVRSTAALVVGGGAGGGARGDLDGTREGNWSGGDLGRAGGRRDQRPIRTERAISQAAGVLGGTRGTVGVGGAAASVVGVAAVGRALGGRDSSRDRAHVGDGAGAVGDGEGGGLLDGVSLGAVGDDRGTRAVGGEGVDDLGDIDGVGHRRAVGDLSGAQDETDQERAHGRSHFVRSDGQNEREVEDGKRVDELRRNRDVLWKCN